jgi:hypothetical protein
MAPLSCRDLKKGMRVVLMSPSPNYDIGRNNPKVGTRWECGGSVTCSHKGFVDVSWDNGSSNTYKDYELSLTSEGRCESIW